MSRKRAFFPKSSAAVPSGAPLGIRCLRRQGAQSRHGPPEAVCRQGRKRRDLGRHRVTPGGLGEIRGTMKLNLPKFNVRSAAALLGLKNIFGFGFRSAKFVVILLYRVS